MNDKVFAVIYSHIDTDCPLDSIDDMRCLGVFTTEDKAKEVLDKHFKEVKEECDNSANKTKEAANYGSNATITTGNEDETDHIFHWRVVKKTVDFSQAD